MTDEQIPPPQVFPCGCLITCAIEDGLRVATLSPCRQTCRIVDDSLDLVAELGKAYGWRSAP